MASYEKVTREMGETEKPTKCAVIFLANLNHKKLKDVFNKQSTAFLLAHAPAEQLSAA